MDLVYATVTSKGQITLPIELRRELGIEPGQKVGFRREGRSFVLEPAGDIETVRGILEATARRNGTWGSVPDTADAWQEAAVNRYAGS